MRRLLDSLVAEAAEVEDVAEEEADERGGAEDVGRDERGGEQRALHHELAHGLVDGGQVYRTFCYVDDAVESVVRMVDRPERSIGHAFNVGNPNNNIQVKALAQLMIELYSNITGKPQGTTQEISGQEYYGKGYEDSDLRIPSMRLVKSQLDWEPSTSLKQAMESTMKVFLEKYADKLAAKRAAADAAAPAAKAARR